MKLVFVNGQKMIEDGDYAWDGDDLRFSFPIRDEVVTVVDTVEDTETIYESVLRPVRKSDSADS